MFNIKGKYTTALCTIDVLEHGCAEQIQSLCHNPVFEDQQVVIMPDVHVGAGVPIGTTATVSAERISPVFVGVDIGCGVLAMQVSKPTQTLQVIDQMIKDLIPMGNKINSKRMYEWPQQEDIHLAYLCRVMQLDLDYIKRSIGSLGSGNHFIQKYD